MSKDIVKFVRKANNLVEARYKFDIWETRIFTKTLSLIHRDDEDFKEYIIYLRDIIDDFGLQGANASYDFLRNGARKLMKKSFFIPYETKTAVRLLEVPIIASLDSLSEMKKGGGSRAGQEYIKISFHPKMKPYLLQLKSQFTMYDVRNILKLPSVYSIRIYELLKQYERIGKRTIEITELKEMLGITEEYPLYANFKQRVISKAQRDLKKHTDISFTFKQIKKGRAVHKLTFFIAENTPNRDKEKPPAPTIAKDAVDEIYVQVQEWVSKKVVAQWLQNYPEEQVRKNVAYTLNRLQKGDRIENVGGYLQAMIRKENVVDTVAEKQQKATAQKRRQQLEQQQQQVLRDTLHRLKQEMHNKAKTLIEKIFAERPDLREATFEAVKNSRLAKYDPHKTEAANYEQPLFQAAVQSRFKKEHPDYFKALHEFYLPKIKELEAKLR